MTTIDHAAEIIADAFRPLMRGHSDSLGRDLARALADAGLLAPDCMTYEYGDNGWDDETNSPMHYPVEPSCRDDDHYCPEPAPPRYRRLVGPWEEADREPETDDFHSSIGLWQTLPPATWEKE